MNILLGNLGLERIVEPDYLETIKTFLDNNGYKKTDRVDDVRLSKGNYHIYDIPRVMFICGEDKMQDFIKFLQENDLVKKAFIGRIGLSFV